MLDERSDRVLVQNLGKSTEGNPFILAIISSSFYREGQTASRGFIGLSTMIFAPRLIVPGA